MKNNLGKSQELTINLEIFSYFHIFSDHDFEPYTLIINRKIYPQEIIIAGHLQLIICLTRNYNYLFIYYLLPSFYNC